jgi:hypothetical protein
MMGYSKLNIFVRAVESGAGFVMGGTSKPNLAFLFLRRKKYYCPHGTRLHFTQFKNYLNNAGVWFF